MCSWSSKKIQEFFAVETGSRKDPSKVKGCTIFECQEPKHPVSIPLQESQYLAFTLDNTSGNRLEIYQQYPSLLDENTPLEQLLSEVKQDFVTRLFAKYSAEFSQRRPQASPFVFRREQLPFGSRDFHYIVHSMHFNQRETQAQDKETLVEFVRFLNGLMHTQVSDELFESVRVELLQSLRKQREALENNHPLSLLKNYLRYLSFLDLEYVMDYSVRLDFMERFLQGLRKEDVLPLLQVSFEDHRGFWLLENTDKRFSSQDLRSIFEDSVGLWDVYQADYPIELNIDAQSIKNHTIEKERISEEHRIDFYLLDNGIKVYTKRIEDMPKTMIVGRYWDQTPEDTPFKDYSLRKIAQYLYPFATVGNLSWSKVLSFQQYHGISFKDFSMSEPFSPYRHFLASTSSKVTYRELFDFFYGLHTQAVWENEALLHVYSQIQEDIDAFEKNFWDQSTYYTNQLNYGDAPFTARIMPQDLAEAQSIPIFDYQKYLSFQAQNMTNLVLLVLGTWDDHDLEAFLAKHISSLPHRLLEGEAFEQEKDRRKVPFVKTRQEREIDLSITQEGTHNRLMFPLQSLESGYHQYEQTVLMKALSSLTSFRFFNSFRSEFGAVYGVSVHISPNLYDPSEALLTVNFAPTLKQTDLLKQEAFILLKGLLEKGFTEGELQGHIESYRTAYEANLRAPFFWIQRLQVFDQEEQKNSEVDNIQWIMTPKEYEQFLTNENLLALLRRIDPNDYRSIRFNFIPD